MSIKEVVKTFLYLNGLITFSCLIGYILVPESLLFNVLWLVYLMANTAGITGLILRQYQEKQDATRDRFLCYLNGEFYGSGDLEYMDELFRDYVVACEMYGKDTVDFKVERATTLK